MENSTINCSNDYYNEKRFVAVAITSATSAGVSLIACIFAAFIVILFKKWQSFGQRLITYLLIAATLNSAMTIIRRVDFDENFTEADDHYCTFSAFATQIIYWFLVTSIIAITTYLFLGVTFHKFTDRHEYLYIAFIYGFPCTFSWIPFINHTYGRAGAWCWIKLVDFDTCHRIIFGQVLQLVIFYIPLLIILPTIITAYLIMLYNLHKRRKHWKTVIDDTSKHTNKLMKSETAYLLVYPLIFITLTMPILVTRIQNWADPQNPIVALWHISGMGINLNGFGMSLAFLLEKDTRHRLKWSHIRAAFKNYRTNKGVAEYAVGDTEDPDEKERPPYRRFTNNSFFEDKNTLELL